MRNRKRSPLAASHGTPFVLFAILLIASSCGDNEQRQRPSPVRTSQPTHAAAARKSTAAASEPLPRTLGGVTLGARRSEAERALGTLNCHASPAGYDVCRRATSPGGPAARIELYIYHQHVLSLALETAPPENAPAYLDKLQRRYGMPSLRGATERDPGGRTHEIHGWKDAKTLYAVRFIRRADPKKKPRLVGMAITLWDRAGYKKWEAESARPIATPREKPTATPQVKPTHTPQNEPDMPKLT